jgi:predicted DCC family thiol-disulfide oxidoreductase YuxK
MPPTTDYQDNNYGDSDNRTVVFFDGVCNLCNGAVNWLIDHDSSGRLRFAPLQGSTFAEYSVGNSVRIGSDTPHSVSTIVLWHEGRTYTHSGAVLRALGLLGGLWRMAWVLLIVPPFVRDAVYQFIAQNRYRWFGKQETCRIPTPELKAKFLP